MRVHNDKSRREPSALQFSVGRTKLDYAALKIALEADDE